MDYDKEKSGDEITLMNNTKELREKFNILVDKLIKDDPIFFLNCDMTWNTRKKK